MKVNYSGKTEIGKVRKNNQDSIYVSLLGNGYYLAIVADGMGGHNGGDFASKEAVRLAQNYLNTLPPKEHNVEKELKNMLNKINNYLYSTSLSNPMLAGMGTTFTLFLFKEKGYILHVGDSRLYHYDGKMEQLTTDHTLVNELLLQGAITKEQAFNHPQRNVLTSALGSSRNLEFQVQKVKLEYGYYLLCSDGFYNELTDRDMMNILDYQETVFVKTEKMLARALSREASDNISLVLIEVTK